MRKSTLQKRLEAARDKVSKDRDTLRGIENDAQELADCCERAVDALNEAIDALSELA